MLKLSKMGGTDWAKAKNRAKSAAKDMAKELIALYAARMKREGFAFPKDDSMQEEFEQAFDYEETDSEHKRSRRKTEHTGPEQRYGHHRTEPCCPKRIRAKVK